MTWIIALLLVGPSMMAIVSPLYAYMVIAKRFDLRANDPTVSLLHRVAVWAGAITSISLSILIAAFIYEAWRLVVYIPEYE